ncbi:hypothetical protein D3C71_1634980 [compost metagenome]
MAHVLRQHALGLHGVPQARRFQRALRVAPHRHRCRVAVGHALDVIAGQVFQRRDIGLAVSRHDQHDLVRREIHTRGPLHRLFFNRLVHRLLVGRGKHIGRRALQDLLQQDVGRAEVQHDLGVRVFLFVGLRHVLEGVGQAGRGGYDQVGGLRARHPEGGKRQGQRGQRTFARHGFPWKLRVR